MDLVRLRARLTARYRKAFRQEEQVMKNLLTAVLMTIITTVFWAWFIRWLSPTCAGDFPEQANGQLIRRGVVIGSRIISQPFWARLFRQDQVPGVAGTIPGSSGRTDLPTEN